MHSPAPVLSPGSTSGTAFASNLSGDFQDQNVSQISNKKAAEWNHSDEEENQDQKPTSIKIQAKA